jgi:hypothetical protein
MVIFLKAYGLVWIEEYWSVFWFNPPHGEDSFSFLNYSPGLDENTQQYSFIQAGPTVSKYLDAHIRTIIVLTGGKLTGFYFMQFTIL